jgi:hypothetical protein
MTDCIASHFNGWRQGEHLFSKKPIGMIDLDGFLASWNFWKISSVPTGLLPELLLFQVPEVKTSGYNIARPYGTVSNIFQRTILARRRISDGGMSIWKKSL